MNPYKILEVNKNSNKKEIKKAYRNKSKKHHPDVGGDKQQFSLISKSYQILMDDEKRERYDKGENIDSILNPKNDKSIEVIAQIYCTLLNDLDPEDNNIIKMIKDHINQTISKINNELYKQEVLKQRFKTCLNKIKHKDKTNILFEVSNSKIKEIDLHIEKVNDQLNHFKKAIKILEDFDYDIIERVQLSTFADRTYTTLL